MPLLIAAAAPPIQADALLLGAGLLAGFIDAIAGGGGLIALPAISLVVGPGLDAIGSNKVASLSAAAIAFAVYLWRGHVKWKSGLLFAATVGVGSLLGSLFARLEPVGLFPWLLAITCPIILYFVWQKDLWAAREVDSSADVSMLAVVLAGIACGFYDGAWGPGGGTFMFLALLVFAKMPLLASLAASKLANTFSATVGLATYGAGGYVHWHEGIVLASGMLTGAFFGSNLASTRASRIVRPMLLVVVLLLVVKVIATTR